MARSAASGSGSNRLTTPSKGQLDLERHGGRTTEGLYARIAQRLAMAACIWHNWATGATVKRSLIACDN